MTKPVRIMMIDDREEFAELFQIKLREAMPDIDFALDWHEDLEEGMVFDHDAYIVDNRINGIAKGVEIVEAIKAQHGNAVIFVFSNHGDYHLLKDLFRLDVEYYVDKKEMDLVPVVTFIKSGLQFREKTECMAAKLDAIAEMAEGEPEDAFTEQDIVN